MGIYDLSPVFQLDNSSMDPSIREFVRQVQVNFRNVYGDLASFFPGGAVGDLLVGKGKSFSALPVGANKKVLMADSTATLKMAWKDVDHGDLTGLTDDDHTQYLLVEGDRSFTGLTAGDLLQWDGTRWQNTSTSTLTTMAAYSKSAAYAALAENQLILGDASGGAFDVTLPPAASAKGYTLRVKKVDASADAITILPDGAETIDGAASLALSTQYEAKSLVSDGTAWWVI